MQAQVIIAPWRPQLPDWEFYLAQPDYVARTGKWARGDIWADRWGGGRRGGGSACLFACRLHVEASLGVLRLAVGGQRRAEDEAVVLAGLMGRLQVSGSWRAAS